MGDLVVGHSGFDPLLCNAVLNRFVVSHGKFQIDDGDVPLRINGVLNMDDIRGIEAADDLADGVAFADGGQELIAQALLAPFTKPAMS